MEVFMIDPSRMNRDRDKMAERILHLTLEILFRLTGEDYTVVKKTSSDRCQAPVSEGWGRPLSPITGPPPHPPIHEDINDQKILELTYKMIELLTGEVPIRCQDVTVYFSMEEWEYLEGHKDLYKDIMMEVPQPLTSPGLSSKRTTPERCPRPLLLQDCKQEDPDVPQDDQGEDLTHINTTETYVRGDERSKEEIPTDDRPDDCARNSEGHLISLDFKSDDFGISDDTYEKHVVISDEYSALYMKDLSSDPFRRVLPYDSSQTLKQNCNQSDVKRHTSHTGEKTFSGSDYWKHSVKSSFVTPQSIFQGEKPYSCSECKKCFALKSYLVQHQKTHTGEKPYSCSECGKCFTLKSNLLQHQNTHTGEKPFSCSECEKCFARQSVLATHKKTHLGKKPYSCSECEKCFANKSNFVQHQKTHTGEKPYSCSECEKCFSRKSYLAQHQNSHTGNMPYLCSECGKRFSRKSAVFKHKKTHAVERQFKCLDCGKGFHHRSNLERHQITHTGVKPYSCSECGKYFTRKASLMDHQITQHIHVLNEQNIGFRNLIPSDI
ncbi:oocyte zinc finger protein XlCOF7.1-like [Anomaloglossus baeobatrachus]